MADAARPRRFDVTMSRRTRRAATVPAADCQQDQGIEMNKVKPVVELKMCQPLEEQIAPKQQRLDGGGDNQQHGQDGSRCLSLKELIDEAIHGDGEDAATGDRQGQNAASDDEEIVAQGDVASRRTQPEHVQGRGVMAIMRRYVRVRYIKAKHAPEMNTAPAR